MITRWSNQGRPARTAPLFAPFPFFLSVYFPDTFPYISIPQIPSHTHAKENKEENKMEKDDRKKKKKEREKGREEPSWGRWVPHANKFPPIQEKEYQRIYYNIRHTKGNSTSGSIPLLSTRRKGKEHFRKKRGKSSGDGGWKMMVLNTATTSPRSSLTGLTDFHVGHEGS